MSGGAAFGLDHLDDPDPDGDFDATDPYSHPGFRRFARKAREELLPKIDASAMVMSFIMDGDPDVKWAIEMGFSIMLDKPIIAVITPGRKVPSKLAAVVDAWVEWSDDKDEMAKRIREAMVSIDLGDEDDDD